MASRSYTVRYPHLGILIVLGGLVYQNAIPNGFVYDDSAVVVDNYYIKHPAYLPALVTSSYFDFFGEKSYRPIVSLSYFLDHFLWGLDSKGFHFTNLLLHCANACLFFVFLGRLFENKKWVFFAALLFTLHPVMTEAVNSISFREELLTALCTFGSLALFLRVRMDPSISKIKLFLCVLFSSLIFAAGLLSKESMMIFPFLAGLVCARLEGRNPQKNRAQNLAFGIAFLIVWGLYVFVRFYWFENEQGINAEIFTETLWTRVLTGISIAGYYLKLLLFPFPLAPDYTFPPSAGMELLRTGVTIWVFAIVSFWVWGRGELRFGWLWFLIALVPTLNIYPIANPMAERYLYLPSCGAYVVFAAGLHRFLVFFSPPFSPLWKKHFAAIKTILLLCFAVLTLNRNFDWKNSDSLWEKAYKVTPRSYIILNNLGVSLKGKGDYNAAIRVLNQSLAVNPGNIHVYPNLGLAYHELGNDKLAVEVLEKGLKMDPANALILINLAKIKIETDAVDEGLKLLDRAIEIKPYLAEPFLIKGNWYAQHGSYQKAYEAYWRAALNRPDYAEPLINVGALHGRLGQFEEAVKALRRALEIAPSDPAANLNLAAAYYFLKDYENAGKYAKIAKKAGAVLPEVLLPLAPR